MLISHKWLQTYIPDINKYSQEEIAEELTKSLAEVEQVIPIRQELKNIVVGEIIRVEKHENSNKLSICYVTTDGNNKIQIVCGASNVAEKQRVAVCLPGGVVYGSDKSPIGIKTTTIRGVESSGMLCSARELGVGDNHEGILVLEDNIDLGTDLTELLQDYAYEIENKSLTHRSDCFSHKGIARELSAILSLDFLTYEENLTELVPTEQGNHLNIEIKINGELVKRFSALLIGNIEIKPSPLWLQSRLTAVGERSINNIVDITNYVMLDQGQPLHAYDYDKLKGHKLIVRKARKSEEIITLDKTTRKLDSEMIVITDDDSIENIAGIMGGAKSQITNNTKTIILEAANWEMYNIRRTSRQLGHRTEASTRFEKGLDPKATIPTLESAYTLITDLAGGELYSDIFDYYPSPEQKKQITVDINHINRILSLNLTKYEVTEILERLGITEVETEGDGAKPNIELQNQITFDIPTFRRDLNIKEDLIEEIARIYGYENLVLKIPVIELTPANIYPTSRLFRAITTILSNLGFYETKTYSFIGEEIYKKANLDINNCLEIINPLAPELKFIRTSILPSLLLSAKKSHLQKSNLQLFEISRVVQKELDKENLHIQPWTLGALIITDTTPEQSYLEMKGILENLSLKLQAKLRYKPSKSNSGNNKLFHPYQFADIFFENKIIGYIGNAHPEVIHNFRLKGNIALIELNLESLIPLVYKSHVYKQLVNYPESSRDLSFWVPTELNYFEIEEFITTLTIPFFKSLLLKDSYFDKEENKRSLTITTTFQSSDKTLTDQEINKLVSYITEQLESKFKLKLRE